MWAAHIVHHQSEELNLTTVFRVSAFAVIFRTPFWSVVPLIGFDPAAVTVAIAMIGFYQMLVHTRLVKSWGILEKFMVTPSNPGSTMPITMPTWIQTMVGFSLYGTEFLVLINQKKSRSNSELPLASIARIRFRLTFFTGNTYSA